MFGFEISELDDLNTNLDQLLEAMRAVHGMRCEFHLDLAKPAEVERAIRETDQTIDKRLAGLSDNPFAKQIGDSAKEQFRERIIKQAAKARNHPPSSGSGNDSGCPPVPLLPGIPVRPLGISISPFRTPAPKGGYQW